MYGKQKKQERLFTMNFNKKLLSISALTAALVGGVGTAHAQVDVDASADFLEALVINNVNDMEFNTIEQSAAIAGGDLATLNTDGTIVYAGNFTGTGVGVAGEVQVTAGSNGSTVDVFCEDTAVLTNAGGGSSVNVTGVSVDIQTGTATAGADACVDLSTPATNFVLDVGTTDTVLLGGVLDGGTAAAFVAAPHTTTNPGGNNITVDVQYQ